MTSDEQTITYLAICKRAKDRAFVLFLSMISFKESKLIDFLRVSTLSIFFEIILFNIFSDILYFF